MKLYFEPEYILQLDDSSESTWVKDFKREYFVDKGAVFRAMTKLFYHALILQFAVRKRKFYRNEMTVRNAIKFMYDGAKKHIKTCNYQ